MGGGSTTKTEAVDTKTDPWSGQQPFLTDAFNQAKGIYDAQKGTPGYQGDYYAAPTQAMKDAFQGNMGFASGAGKDAATTAAGTGTAAAASGLAGSNSALGQIFGMTGAQTDANIAAAGKYAANPYMDGMVDAASRDISRNVNENVMPGIARGAAATGNINSTRTGVAEGIAQRGLQDTIGDISAQLRGTAYQSGIGAAQQDYTNRLGAMMGGAQTASGLLSQGLAGLESGANINNTNTNTNLTSATMLNGYDQNALDNEYQKYTANKNSPWENLSNYYGIIGGNNWGSATTGTNTTKTQSNPSMLSTLGSGLGIIGSLFKCDINTKTDISFITTLEDGINLYTFRYKNDPSTLHTGPMAQEVESKYPDAIVEIDGIKHINTAVYDWR